MVELQTALEGRDSKAGQSLRDEDGGSVAVMRHGMRKEGKKIEALNLFAVRGTAWGMTEK